MPTFLRRVSGSAAVLLALAVAPPSPSQAQRLLHAPATWHGASGAAADTISEYEMRHGWFSRDKGYHFAISAVGAGALYAGARRLGLARWHAAIIAVGVMGTAGVLREIGRADRHDILTKQKLSHKDLVWDGVGIAVGLGVAEVAMTASRRREAPVPGPTR